MQRKIAQTGSPKFGVILTSTGLVTASGLSLHMSLLVVCIGTPGRRGEWAGHREGGQLLFRYRRDPSQIQFEPQRNHEEDQQREVGDDHRRGGSPGQRRAHEADR